MIYKLYKHKNNIYKTLHNIYYTHIYTPKIRVTEAPILINKGFY